MFGFKNINEELKPYLSVESIFDYYRLVDPKTHEVFRYDNGNSLLVQEGTCYDIWERKEKCGNCVSKYTCDKQRQQVKLEYFRGKILLIVARPVKVEGRSMALEFMKDVTLSMIGVSYYHSDNSSIEDMVNQLNELAGKDILTGLYNKDYTRCRLEEFISEKGNNHTLVGAALDIDGYTQVNFLYGHNLGNQVLQYVAETVRKHVPATQGWIGRMGSDEIGLFCEDKTVEEMMSLCKDIYNEVENHDFKINNDKFHVTFSFAATELQKEEDADDFIGRLYFQLRTAQVKK